MKSFSIVATRTHVSERRMANVTSTYQEIASATGFQHLPSLPDYTLETKLLPDRDFRLDWAEKVGLGFELPKRSVGLPGLLIPFRKVG